MRIVRHILLILAILSTAALPGPAHACAGREGHAPQIPMHRADVASQHDDRGCPDHDHGKCCVSACCTPTCLPSGDLLTWLPAELGSSLLVRLRTDDEPRDGAVPGLPKRPPKTV